ncbi:MAG: glycosyltransferase family 39 protein [Solirubrobacteraceae bacterium]|nr:glycosyltransferase family 39 protein [Solirubrobacteraceae bacterium]
MRRPVQVLIALQLAFLAVAGTWTALEFPVWALTDELAHFDYVRVVADDARLPVLGENQVTAEEVALGGDGAATGLRAQSYEAFQPPAYYVLLAPAVAVGGQELATVRALRLLGVLMLGVAAWLTWLLARRVFADDEDELAAPAALALALCVLVLPAVVVRNATVSNTALALPMALAVTVLTWDALRRADPRRLIVAGVVLGLALLVRTELVVLAPLLLGAAFVLWRRGEVGAGPALVAVAAPAVLLLPWIALNLHRYGALTASDLAREMQDPVLNPDGTRYGVGDLPDLGRRVAGGMLPEEWWVRYLSSAWRALRDVLAAIVVLVPLGLVLWRPPARLGRAAAFLVAPLVLTLAGLVFVLFAAQFDLLQPRYLHPVLPAYALFVALALRQVLAPRWIAGIAAAATVGIGVVWLLVGGGPTYTG